LAATSDGVAPLASIAAMTEPVDVPANMSTLSKKSGTAASSRSISLIDRKPRQPPPSQARMTNGFLAGPCAGPCV